MKKILIVAILYITSLFSTNIEYKNALIRAKNEHKIIIIMLEKEDCHFCKKMEDEVFTANNVIKFYGVDNTEVVIVAYSQGIKALLKDGNLRIKRRVKSLMTYDVEFIACGNTMKTLKIKKDELIDGVEVVTAGIVELIERQLRGYIYIRP